MYNADSKKLKDLIGEFKTLVLTTPRNKKGSITNEGSEGLFNMALAVALTVEIYLETEGEMHGTGYTN